MPEKTQSPKGGRDTATKKTKSSKKPLDIGDETLWNSVIHDVTPLQQPKITPLTFQKNTPKKALPKPLTAPIRLETYVAQKLLPESSLQMDGALRKRFDAGNIPLDATLDLHGLTLANAHRRLNEFILRCTADGARMILVITGKGKDGAGLIRQQFPIWCETATLGSSILRISPAQPKHGGSGAFYIFLRRKR